MDIFWWLAATGRLARTIDDMPDVVAARRENSLQLVGNPDPSLRGRDLDLGALQARGVRLVGRMEKSSAPSLRFAATSGKRLPTPT
jgi:putative flavoprotein involved in K+ transport